MDANKIIVESGRFATSDECVQFILSSILEMTDIDLLSMILEDAASDQAAFTQLMQKRFADASPKFRDKMVLTFSKLLKAQTTEQMIDILKKRPGAANALDYVLKLFAEYIKDPNVINAIARTNGKIDDLSIPAVKEPSNPVEKEFKDMLRSTAQKEIELIAKNAFADETFSKGAMAHLATAGQWAGGDEPTAEQDTGGEEVATAENVRVSPNLTCPHCSSVLRPASPVPAGKKVRCPKCAESFTAGGEQEAAKDEMPSAEQSKDLYSSMDVVAGFKRSVDAGKMQVVDLLKSSDYREALNILSHHYRSTVVRAFNAAAKDGDAQIDGVKIYRWLYGKAVEYSPSQLLALFDNRTLSGVANDDSFWQTAIAVNPLGPFYTLGDGLIYGNKKIITLDKAGNTIVAGDQHRLIRIFIKALQATDLVFMRDINSRKPQTMEI